MPDAPSHDDEPLPTRKEVYAWRDREATRHQLPDGFLEVFVKTANTDGLQVGVTLTVGGSLISGITESEDDYNEAVAATIEAAGHPSLADAIRQGYNEGKATRDQGHAPEDGVLPDTGMLREGINHIHLKDVTFMTFGGEHLNVANMPHWRGRLSAVDGWSFGNVRPS